MFVRLAGWLLTVWSLTTAAAGYQSLDAIRTAAERFIATQPAPGGAATEVHAGALDPRLLLPACGRELEAFLPSGGRTVGNTTVGVRCTGGAEWTVYVPVRVAAFADVVVAARPVARGATLTVADLRRERHDLAALPYGYVLDPAQVAGKRVLRGLGAGAVLTPNLLTAPQWIKRGTRVTLLAEAGGMQVRMNGEALMDGSAGDTVRVRNLSSERVVEGTVIAEGVIQVRL